MGFNERKVAQMAAFFLGQSQDWKMPHLKLMALLYLSDREAVRAFGWTISGDCLISLYRGPVLLRTLNLMNGDAKPQPVEWEKWISDDGNDVLSLCQHIDTDNLDELSQSEIETLKVVWDKFADMDKWAICYWTRQHCTEWEDPKGGPYRPIQYDALARAVGFDDASAKAVAEQIQTEQGIDRLFRGLR